MRKYLNIAKKIVPELTREAADYIAEEYSKLRNQENLQGDLARVSSSLTHIGLGTTWSINSLSIG